MNGKHILPGIALALAIALGSSGCGKSDSGSSGNSGGSADSGSGEQLSGTEREARDAVVAEIQRHWVKAPDGWITERVTGSGYSPDHFLREVHDLVVFSVSASDLSDSDRMNGFEWVGWVKYKKLSCREGGDPGFLLDGMAGGINRQRGQWTQWVDYDPDAVHVWKKKGQWEVDQDTWLLRGTLPTPQDFANAGVH